MYGVRIFWKARVTPVLQVKAVLFFLGDAGGGCNVLMDSIHVSTKKPMVICANGQHTCIYQKVNGDIKSVEFGCFNSDK